MATRMTSLTHKEGIKSLTNPMTSADLRRDRLLCLGKGELVDIFTIKTLQSVNLDQKRQNELRVEKVLMNHRSYIELPYNMYSCFLLSFLESGTIQAHKPLPPDAAKFSIARWQ